MVRLNKAFYLGSVISVYVLTVVIWIAAVGGMSRGNSDAVALLGFVWILLIYLAVVFCMMVGKMWAAIQDGHARTTPGKAVGFLFIPFFNFYWGFQALSGFATDYNAVLDRYGLNLKKLPVGLYTAYMVLCLVALVPVLGVFAVLANFVVAPIMISKTCDAVNALPENYQIMQPSQTESDGTIPAQQVPQNRPGLSTGAKVGIAAGIAFGLLIILGIVAAIAIPSLLSAKQKANSKRTAADIRTLTSAIEAYLSDYGELPHCSGRLEPDSPFMAELVPVYMQRPITTDSWQHPIHVYTNEACNGVYGMKDCGPGDYLVISHGKDGIEDDWEYDPYNDNAGTYQQRGSLLYETDLVMYNAHWIRKPEHLRY